MTESNALPNDLTALDTYSGSEAIDRRLDTAQMLSLIDSILPFEACLYHEIIPLSVEASCLHLGVVNPQDSVALDYARRQISFIRCTLVPWPVSSDWQRKMLSQYLSHAARAKQRSQSVPAAQAQTLPSSDELLTFIVDSPEDLRTEDLGATDRGAEVLPTSPKVLTPSPTPPADAPAIAPEAAPLVLALDQAVGRVPLTQLHHLSPPQLTQALLTQVLSEGIGRLYLERGATQGRVLWSKDGVLQAALNPLSFDQLQSVINELKRLTHLPLLPTTQSKQADIERLYRGDRVLLRLRLIPGSHGEEATLQVLRGAALKFYQQQQLKQLGEDALGVAQTLQKRISEIRHRARLSLNIEPPSAHTLDALSQLLKTMEEQLDQIRHASHAKSELHNPDAQKANS
ncbi:hypothetical protein [Nodosilinea sp. E11]|uniref:hypothetical protein n=1 Tax=Nodosilinea sp. E11 TaxID=3037479 RepID=UPI002934BBF9|nr:hypothetical protein [Nodosilinea sp. E11]WOD41784.1 hypothetical protein RRF56_13395 [Nodosilinea sp. E11]